MKKNGAVAKNNKYSRAVASSYRIASHAGKLVLRNAAGKMLKSKLQQSSSRSKTKTRTARTATADFSNARNGTEVSSIRFSTGNKSCKGVLKSNMLLHESYAGTQEVGSNQESYQVICCSGTTSQWLTTTDDTNQNRSETGGCAIFSLNPTQGVYGGDKKGNKVAPAIDKMALKHAVYHIDLFNRTVVPQKTSHTLSIPTGLS